MTDKSVILILAAGEARRMGRVKQLLDYGGKSLIQWAIENAQATGLPVIVVLGAHSDQIRPLVAGYSVNYVINENWRKGISTSIHAGMNYAMEHFPGLTGVLITLTDQPKITTDHLNSILKSATSKSEMVATEYEGVSGVPAYYPRKYFEQLKKLKGDRGAVVLIKKWSKHVVNKPFPAAAQDIDTEQDWKDFRERG